MERTAQSCAMVVLILKKCAAELMDAVLNLDVLNMEMIGLLEMVAHLVCNLSLALALQTETIKYFEILLKSTIQLFY